MKAVIDAIVSFSGYLWGWPIITLLFVSSVFLTFRLKFIQFRRFGYIMKQTFGKIFSKEEAKGEGTLSAFQALTTAVACVVGAGNITGVPVAIMLGGPGAVFWIWVIALLGMGLKYSEIALAVKYRVKNEKGDFVGGPTHYMEKGLKMHWLAVFFALGLVFEVFVSVMVQANSLAASAQASMGINPLLTGVVVMVLTGVVVIGGIRTIGKFTEKFVPLMATFYIVLSLVIVFLNIEKLPAVFSMIFAHAFTPSAAIGGFTGSAVAAGIRHGFARGLYSNESGLGTSPIAHATATTDHPVRQAFWGVTENFIDTILICTCTALAVLTTGVWTLPDASTIAGGLTTTAFIQSFGGIGGIFLTISLMMFVYSTLITLIYYGEAQAGFLWGYKASIVTRWIYVIVLPLGAVGGAQFLWQFLDLALAAILIPNVIALVLLNKEIVALTEDFFSSDKFLLKDAKAAQLSKESHGA
jgi:AGCS family alanine or glycine:cation symporter